jgi:hypothetical protein
MMSIKKEPTLVIMAAGMGSRYGGLKQMDSITKEGEILLDFSLYDAVRAGFKKVVFVIKKEIEADFRPLVEGKSDKHIEVAYAFQEINDLPNGYKIPQGREKPWGTSHAVLVAKDLIDGPICVINADDYYGPAAFEKAYNYLAAAKDDELYRYGMVGYEVQNTLTDKGTVTRGVCEVDQEGYLAHITERGKIKWEGENVVFTEDDGATWENIPIGTTVSMNCWLFTESFLQELETSFTDFLDETVPKNPLKSEWLLPRSVDALLVEGKATVEVLKSDDQWYGVTYQEDRDLVMNAMEKLKQDGLYPRELWPAK